MLFLTIWFTQNQITPQMQEFPHKKLILMAIMDTIQVLENLNEYDT